MAERFTIVGLGEALFDIIADAQVLGGAPLNVAVHAHRLASARGGCATVVSRVGQDELGRQVIEQLRSRGLSAEYLQTDPDHPTGRVYVNLDQDGQPHYDIARDVAWDWLQFDPDTESLARRCDAVCFGSLAQRTGQSRSSIHRFLAAADRAIRLFDVNLRQDAYDPHILRTSCQAATAVKLNHEELPTVTDLLGLASPPGHANTSANTDADANAIAANPTDAGAFTLLSRFNLQMVVLTHGAQGTTLYTPQRKLQGPPVRYESAENADPVGAGDACSAGLLVGLVLRLEPEKTLDLANHMGAFVASQPGATPDLPPAILEKLTP